MTSPSGELVVRPASITDLGEVARIERDSFADPWSTEALFSELLADQMRHPLVAERNGSVCGYIMAWVVVDQLHVLNIATDPECLRQGVATSLLREATRRALPLGVVEITLEVRRSNYPALGFYRRHGFVQAGVRPGYYQDNGEDALILTAPCADLLAD